ncbi:hypothetical protein SLS62_010339 [Diatrype stigma]|uniref:Uncharacterized protein n=1 Tax=Diatrype stigma TaxID=117547 RepID=A0AAN9U9B8_9PEZI
MHRAMLSLKLDISPGDKKIPESSSDPALKALVQIANDPPKNHEEQQKSLDLLEAYLEQHKQKENEDSRKANDEAKQSKQKPRESRHKQLSFTKKTQKVFRTLNTSMKNLFRFVSKVLYSGIKVLAATAFIVSEVTSQTHYEVAIKAIMLFITVFYLCCCPGTSSVLYTNNSHKTYENVGELDDDIVSMFQVIDDYSCEIRTLREKIKSVPMFKAISKLFVSIMAFIVAAGSYMKHGTLSKHDHYFLITTLRKKQKEEKPNKHPSQGGEGSWRRS